MAYIAPNSTLQLFKGINLDNRYLHTIYFANETAQNTWFTSKVTIALTFNNLMYRRYGDGAVKVEADATSLLGVSYLRFKNTRTHNKWFYAFVTGIDYINENTTAVYYEIDLMQTWFIQGGSVRPCMVLREHVNSDGLAANLEDEPVGSTIYDCDYMTNFEEFGGYSLVAQTSGVASSSQMYTQGLFSGSMIYIYPCNDSTDAQTAYDYISANMLGSWAAQIQSENLVSLYTVPSWLIDYVDPDDPAEGVHYDRLVEIHPDTSELVMPTSYDQYTPKNKKLFMYPYSYLLCTTHTGEAGIYRWEYFDSNDPKFTCTGTYLGGGEIICYPNDYNGQTENRDAGLIMDNFPLNAFSYDAYQAWVASGGTTRLKNDGVVASFKGVGALFGGAASMMGQLSSSPSQTIKNETYNHAGMIGSTPVANTASSQTVTEYNRGFNISGITSMVGNLVSGVGSLIEAKNKISYVFPDAKYNPDVAVSKAVANLAVASRDANYYFYHCHVRDSEAKRIDDFFSCYGYSINQVKAPNLTGRQYWNFVQTQNAVIAGDMPSSSKEAIGRIFDGGITFWHNGDQVGNYSQSVSQGSINNPIVT